MRYYFKTLIYHLLEFLSCGANLFSSIIGVYPKFDFGVWYLCELEVKRVRKESELHLKEKEAQLEKAGDLKAEAERTLDVGSQ